MLLVNHYSVSASPPGILARPSKAPRPQKKVPDVTYGSEVGLKKFIKDPLTYLYLHDRSYIKKFSKRALNRLNAEPQKRSLAIALMAFGHFWGVLGHKCPNRRQRYFNNGV